jgi:hypothetical protein
MAARPLLVARQAVDDRLQHRDGDRDAEEEDQSEPRASSTPNSRRRQKPNAPTRVGKG